MNHNLLPQTPTVEDDIIANRIILDKLGVMPYFNHRPAVEPAPTANVVPMPQQPLLERPLYDQIELDNQANMRVQLLAGRMSLRSMLQTEATTADVHDNDLILRRLGVKEPAKELTNLATERRRRSKVTRLVGYYAHRAA